MTTPEQSTAANLEKLTYGAVLSKNQPVADKKIPAPVLPGRKLLNMPKGPSQQKPAENTAFVAQVASGSGGSSLKGNQTVDIPGSGTAQNDWKEMPNKRRDKRRKDKKKVVKDESSDKESSKSHSSGSGKESEEEEEEERSVVDVNALGSFENKEYDERKVGKPMVGIVKGYTPDNLRLIVASGVLDFAQESVAKMVETNMGKDTDLEPVFDAWKLGIATGPAPDAGLLIPLDDEEFEF